MLGYKVSFEQGKGVTENHSIVQGQLKIEGSGIFITLRHYKM